MESQSIVGIPRGDVPSRDQIAIAEGARVNGAIDMGRRALAARVAEYRAGKRN